MKLYAMINYHLNLLIWNNETILSPYICRVTFSFQKNIIISKQLEVSVIFVCKEKEHCITLPDVWVLGVCLCETTASGQEE